MAASNPSSASGEQLTDEGLRRRLEENPDARAWHYKKLEGKDLDRWKRGLLDAHTLGVTIRNVRTRFQHYAQSNPHANDVTIAETLKREFPMFSYTYDGFFRMLTSSSMTRGEMDFVQYAVATRARVERGELSQEQASRLVEGFAATRIHTVASSDAPKLEDLMSKA